ncbi:MAG: carboxymuconolactone decarboxylase family protein [Hydrogenophilaceae bacterium]|nr:carboxymuconolactone decarboxylase family protein [Hydrogenophilaceae bacterium]
MARIAPLEPPYPPEAQAAFDAIMPKGVEPLLLFRTLAVSPRVYQRFRAGSLLDRGPLSLREREIAIDRTCAVTGCAYEWGVHVAFFAARVGLTKEEIAALASPAVDALAWSPRERAIIALCDELNATTRISDATWDALRVAFAAEEILELIALAGFYRTVAYFANGLELAPEPYGAPLPR